MRCDRSSPRHQFHHEGVDTVRLFQTVNDRDVRMVQRREDFRFTLEAGDSFRVCRERLGQDLDGDIAIELRVAGSVHLAHAPFADLRGDFVNAEACAGGEGHGLRDYTGGAAARTVLLLTDAAV